MGRIVFKADTVTLDPALRPLLGRTLRLDALDIAGASLDLPRSEEPFELPRWPDVLPQINPPLAVRADTIRIDGLKVSQEGEPLLDIQRARGGLDASPGALHVEHLAIDSDRGRFAVHGDYLPRDNFRSDLLATAVLPAPAGQSAPRIGLLARGDLTRMDVAIGGRAPAPLRATVTLRGDEDAPRWQLRANGDALDIALLTGSGKASTPLAFDINAEGVGGSASLRGSIKQGDFAAILQPSKVRLDDRRLDLQPLVLDVFGGRVTANGVADLRDAKNASLRFAVNARGLDWRSTDGKTEIGGDADFGIAGTPERWALKGQARLQRGDERATVDVTGNGLRDRMRVTALRASMPQGRLDATGEIAWSPRLEWTAKATLAGFDPGYFAPDWPGTINGAILSNGARRANGSLLKTVPVTSKYGWYYGGYPFNNNPGDINPHHFYDEARARFSRQVFEAAGMSEGAERAIISDYALPRERGTAFGWYHLMVGLAAIPAGLLFGSLWQFQSAATAFFFAGGLEAVAAVLLRMWALPVRKLNAG